MCIRDRSEVVGDEVDSKRMNKTIGTVSYTHLDVYKRQVRVVSWYDNEMSYTCQLIRTLRYMAKLQ